MFFWTFFCASYMILFWKVGIMSEAFPIYQNHRGGISMIESSFEEAFSQEWVETQITDSTNELVILRQIIPWQAIINQLAQFYDGNSGRLGKSLRVMVALLILLRLRLLSDREIVAQVKENRYMQYFCNVPDAELSDFVNPSTLSRFRQRLGKQGIAIIEASVFHVFRLADIIKADTMMTDSTVLSSNIVYPNDVMLVYKAFGKMETFASQHKLSLWWDNPHIKKRWRAFGRAKKGERAAYLAEFYALFVPVLETYRAHVEALEDKAEKAQELLALLTLLRDQTQQKLAGERHIDNRIVSLDAVDARPIKKGKTHPSCEFGTTLQMSFNRQGFMITTENLIGNPSDKTLYGDTLQLFEKRMDDNPDTVVTDLGYRSRDNLKNTPESISNVFLGRSSDVAEDMRDFCRKARSATEGFIAVAKHLRGFGRSLYPRLQGDRIWTLLCQTAYNLKKFLQLFRKGELEKNSLVALGLSMS
jgi:IS5 family transposase